MANELTMILLCPIDDIRTSGTGGKGTKRVIN